MKNSKLQVKCPNCDVLFLYWSTKFRPFCSERCKMIDLGQWLDESYSVPGEHADFESEDE